MLIFSTMHINNKVLYDYITFYDSKPVHIFCATHLLVDNLVRGRNIPLMRGNDLLTLAEVWEEKLRETNHTCVWSYPQWKINSPLGRASKASQPNVFSSPFTWRVKHGERFQAEILAKEANIKYQEWKKAWRPNVFSLPFT